ncbi:MAG: histidine kinase dimerization/phosphoacceptor domain -containing protein [Bacteroidota bacterium]
MKKGILLILIFFQALMGLAQNHTLNWFYRQEYALAKKELNHSEHTQRSQFLNDLIHIWENSGQNSIADSLRLMNSVVVPNSTQELLLRGSYYLFNGQKQNALPIFFDVLRQEEEKDDDMLFIATLGILTIYSQMYALGRKHQYYLNMLHEKAFGDSTKYAWYLVYKMKYNGAQAPTKPALDEYFRWQEISRDFYNNNHLSDALKTHFEYEFGSGAKNRENYSEAERFFRAVIKKGQGQPFLRQVVFNAHLQLASILSDTGQFDSALRQFKEAKKIVSKVDPLLFQLNYNNAIAFNYYEQVEQWDSAYFYLRKNIGSLIPIFMAENNLWVSELKESYDARKREEEITRQQQEISLKERLLLLTVLSAILLIVLLTTTYIAFRGIRKKNQRIEWLMRELHHRVKNNLQVVSSLLGLQSMKLTDETAKKAVAEGKGRIRAMSLIHQRLYQNKAFTRLNINEYLMSLIQELLMVYGLQEKVVLDLEVTKGSLDADTALPVGLLVNELVSNALKYGLPNIEDPILKVSLQHKEGTYQLIISDNGSGFTASPDSSSFGLKLVEILVKQLQGKMKVNNLDGVTYHISFKDHSRLR